MDDNSGEFSDELDVFEESIDESKQKALRNQTTYNNKPYDEAIEISQDLSMAESYDGREKIGRERKLNNDKYDEAVDVSQSFDQMAVSAAAAKARNVSHNQSDAKGLKKGSDQSKSQTVLNKPFDEALEFSHSGSDESIDTRASQKRNHTDNADFKSISQPNTGKAVSNISHSEAKKQKSPPKRTVVEEESSDGEGGTGGGRGGDNEHDVEESFDNLEGQYNPKDYAHLNVTAEVRDLFQYIERYKPQEVELDTPLRCFIPEYIPAIGELDAFIKVPRPDFKEDGLGLRYLDEPSTTQSDPTVLELQLRAKSKKLQYGDVVVRSIEHADRNPQKIEKWIQDINELHRSKPPPQVTYKRNMPEIDRLLDVWPEEFEALLSTVALPSPDLDLSLPEYAKVLCTILDIPTYDNPIEALHLLFTLFVDFRNNPHFQQRLAAAAGAADNNMLSADDKRSGSSGVAGSGGNFSSNNRMNNYGNADVLQMDSDYK